MNEKEAIKFIEFNKDKDCALLSMMPQNVQRKSDLVNKIKAYEIAIAALKKQVPEKPHYDGDSYAPDGTFVWDEWLCPNCNSRYEVDYDNYAYCPNCGQKLDWSEEDEQSDRKR